MSATACINAHPPMVFHAQEQLLIPDKGVSKRIEEIINEAIRTFISKDGVHERITEELSLPRNRVVPIRVNFNDDGQINVDLHEKHPRFITFDNFKTFSKEVIAQINGVMTAAVAPQTMARIDQENSKLRETVRKLESALHQQQLRATELIKAKDDAVLSSQNVDYLDEQLRDAREQLSQLKSRIDVAQELATQSTAEKTTLETQLQEAQEALQNRNVRIMQLEAAQRAALIRLDSKHTHESYELDLRDQEINHLKFDLIRARDEKSFKERELEAEVRSAHKTVLALHSSLEQLAPEVACRDREIETLRMTQEELIRTGRSQQSDIDEMRMKEASQNITRLQQQQLHTLCKEIHQHRIAALENDLNALEEILAARNYEISLLNSESHFADFSSDTDSEIDLEFQEKYKKYSAKIELKDLREEILETEKNIEAVAAIQSITNTDAAIFGSLVQFKAEAEKRLGTKLREQNVRREELEQILGVQDSEAKAEVEVDIINATPEKRKQAVYLGESNKTIPEASSPEE